MLIFRIKFMVLPKKNFLDPYAFPALFSNSSNVKPRPR